MKKKTLVRLIIIAVMSIMIFSGIFLIKYIDQERKYDALAQEGIEAAIMRGVILPGDGYSFNKLKITNVSLRNEWEESEIYATITNTSNRTLHGSIYAIVFYKNEIIGYTRYHFFESTELKPGDSVTVDEICITHDETKIQKYDKIKFYDGGMQNKKID